MPCGKFFNFSFAKRYCSRIFAHKINGLVKTVFKKLYYSTKKHSFYITSQRVFHHGLSVRSVNNTVYLREIFSL